MKNNSKISFEDGLHIKDSTWIDVRCPREFKKGHLTGAVNIPIFSNPEYEQLGTVYRTRGQEKAIELGEEYANRSTPRILEQVSNLNNQIFIIYCARGGMRSKGMEMILNNSSYCVHRINRGYKSIRKHALDTFNEKREVFIIAGSTGTGKTEILKIMEKQGYNIIDLEGLANHRGSTFGDLGLEEQPTQQQFENNLSEKWIGTNKNQPVFIESESRKIGKVVIPEKLWKQMDSGYYLKIEMDIDRRVKNLLDEYGHHKKEKLKDRVNRISKRLGGMETKEAINLLDNNDLSEFCKLLLKKYYDKMYNQAYEIRESSKSILKITNESNDNIIKKIVDLA